jgi:hypothetical protein
MPITEEDLAETLALDLEGQQRLFGRRRSAQESLDYAFTNFSANPTEENLKQLNMAAMIYRHLVAIVLPKEKYAR